MTDEKHEGLPVHGYKPQSPEAVALVNGFKEDEERLLRKLDELAPQPPFRYGETPRYDPRWLAVARTHFQEGFMALNRAVFRPGRIKLPGDPE